MLAYLKLILATWRLTSLLVQEAGPAKVFAQMRQTLPHGGALTCIWCCSIWVALILRFGVRQWAIDVLAVSAGAILYDKWASG